MGGITFSDEEQQDDQEEGSTGKGLRAQLEAALKANSRIEQELFEFKAAKVLTEKGFDLVEAEELKGVPLDKIEEKATELQASKQKVQEKLLRDLLLKQGIAEGDELEQMVQDMTDRQTAESAEAGQNSRVRQLGRLESKPLPLVNPDKLHGIDAIKAGLEQSAAKKRRG